MALPIENATVGRIEVPDVFPEEWLGQPLRACAVTRVRFKHWWQRVRWKGTGDLWVPTNDSAYEELPVRFERTPDGGAQSSTRITWQASRDWPRMVALGLRDQSGEWIAVTKLKRPVTMLAGCTFDLAPGGWTFGPGDTASLVAERG